MCIGPSSLEIHFVLNRNISPPCGQNIRFSFLLIRITSMIFKYFLLPIIYVWKWTFLWYLRISKILKVNEMLNGPVSREWQNWWRQCAMTFYMRQKHAQRIKKKKLNISDVVIKENRAKSNLSVLLSHLCGSFS